MTIYVIDNKSRPLSRISEVRKKWRDQRMEEGVAGSVAQRRRARLRRSWGIILRSNTIGCWWGRWWESERRNEMVGNINLNIVIGIYNGFPCLMIFSNLSFCSTQFTQINAIGRKGDRRLVSDQGVRGAQPTNRVLHNLWIRYKVKNDKIYSNESGCFDPAWNMRNPSSRSIFAK